MVGHLEFNWGDIINGVIAGIYALILIVMLRQQKIMAKQLSEMESSRVAAHRPVLILHRPEVSSLPFVYLRAPEVAQLKNIGAGPALNVRIICHERHDILYEMRLSPIAVGGLSETFDFYRQFELTVGYEDLFGNTYWTHYLPEQHVYRVGEGLPAHLRGE